MPRGDPPCQLAGSAAPPGTPRAQRNHRGARPLPRPGPERLTASRLPTDVLRRETGAGRSAPRSITASVVATSCIPAVGATARAVAAGSEAARPSPRGNGRRKRFDQIEFGAQLRGISRPMPGGSTGTISVKVEPLPSSLRTATLAAVGLDVALDDRQPQGPAPPYSREAEESRLEEGSRRPCPCSSGGDPDPVVRDRDLEIPRAAERPGLRGRPLGRAGPVTRCARPQA